MNSFTEIFADETSLKFKTSLILDRLTALAFFALIVLIPFRSRATIIRRPIGTIYGDYTDFLLFASDILLIILLATWLTRKFLAKAMIRRPHWSLIFPLIVFTFVAALSALGSIDGALSLYHSLRLLLLAGLVFYMADQVHHIHDLILPVSIQLALQSAVAIGQFLSQRDLGLQRFGEYQLNPEWSGVSIVFDHSQRWLRAYGLSDHPNILGGCLAIALLILLGHIIHTDTSRRFFRLWVSLTFVTGCLALFYTFSRSAWLGFACGVALLLLIHSRFGWRSELMRAAKLLTVSALLISPWIFAQRGLVFTRLQPPGAAQVSPTEIQALGERTLLNEASLNVFLEHPILGSGLGSLPQAIRNANPDFGPYYQPAHIVIVAAAAETGLLGVTVYALLLFSPALYMAGRHQLRGDPNAWLIASGLVTVAVIGLFDYYPWLLQPGRLWQYLLWGAWAIVTRSTQDIGSHAV